MGFFSNSDKKSVFANTCHLAEVNSDALQDAVLYAILSGKSIVSSILNTFSNSMSTQMGNFLAYAKDSYSLGLPEVSYESSVVFDEQDVIEAITTDTYRPYGVTLNFHYVAPLVSTMVVAPYLFTVRGWNPETNLIGTYPDEWNVHYWGRHNEGYLNSITFNDDYTSATIKYWIRRYKIAYTGTRDTPKEDREAYKYYINDDYFTETISLPSGLHYGRNYCVAAYHILDAEGSPSDDLYWWYYDISTKLYPALVPSNSIDEANNMLPVIPIRYKNESMVREEVQDTDLYKTSKVLLNKLGIDIDTLASKLEENPNIGDIDHAYVMFGVDLQTEEVASIRYLAEFFDFISDKAQADLFSNIGENSSEVARNTWAIDYASYNGYNFTTGSMLSTSSANSEVSWTSSDGNTSSVTVTSNPSLGYFDEFGLHLEVNYTYIRSDIIQGSIGDIGHATKEWEYNGTSRRIFTGKKVCEDAKLILKVQITENSYKQIIVQGLYLRNYVCDHHVYVTTISDVILNEDEHNFIIPIHYNLSQQMEPILRNQLYLDSLVLVMNSVVITSVKWYSSGFFKFIVMVVGVVISIYTGGAGAWVAALGDAVAAGAMAVVMFLLENVLIAVAVGKILEYVATWVGPEVMAILSVAVAALAGYSKLGGLQGVEFFGVALPTAGQLMGLATSMLSSTNAAYSNLLEEIVEENEKLLKTQEEKLELLEEYSDLIDEPSVDAIDLLNAQTYSATLRQPTTQSPEEFYDLAIHTGNPGVLSLSSISTFADIALTLPKPDTYVLA